MCSRRRARLTAAAALVALGVSGHVAAQESPRPDPGQERARLEADLVERLGELREPLERALERAERERRAIEAAHAARATTPLDTLAVGPLRVVAEPERTDEARALFATAWSDLESMVGGSVDLSEAYFLYDPVAEVGAVALDRHHRISGRDWRDFSFEPDLVERRVRGAIRTEIGHQGPASLRGWTGNRGPQPAREGRLGDLYRRLVLTPSVAAEGCVGGRAEACWAALGLGSSDDPVREWYDADQLSLGRNEALVGWLRCLETNGPALCRDFFGHADWMGVIPFDVQLRADFLAFALEAGGEGALGRLLAEVPDVERIDGLDVLRQEEFARGMRDGLAAAARMDGDELVLGWRARLHAARPDVEETVEETRTATFLWILLFTFFATRSSRWRLA